MGKIFSKYNDLSKNRVVILRGIPGSGKKTIANEIFEKYPKNKVLILSTDDYWFDKNGKYKFEPKKIFKAHQWNQQRFKNAIKSKKFWCIIVNNTNTELWEMKPYIKIVNESNHYVYEIREPLTTRWQRRDLQTCYKVQKSERERSGQSPVPLNVMKKMLDRFKPTSTINLTSI
jgi:adenylate kinase family enzyme